MMPADVMLVIHGAALPARGSDTATLESFGVGLKTHVGLLRILSLLLIKLLT